LPKFAYRAKQTPERVLKGVLEAEDKGQAAHRLRNMGYRIVSLEEAKGVAYGVGLSLGLRRIRGQDLATFWRQLASLLGAGLPPVTSLVTVEEQTENPHLAQVISEVRSAVEGASSFSQGLSRFPDVFGPLQVSIVATGEATGSLPEVAEELADRVENEQDLRGKVRTALVYPIFLCIVGAVVVSVLVTFVIPKFAVMFDSLGQQLPLPTRVLMSISAFAKVYWWLVGLAVIVIAATAYQITRKGPGRLALDALKLRLPVMGKVITKIEMARFAQVLGTLAANGVGIVEALEITAKTLTNSVIAREGVVAGEQIAGGSRVDVAMRRGKHFPPALLNMVAVGEDSSSLPEMLKKTARVYQRESDRAVRSMTALLESVLILALGGIVGGIVAAILLPIFRASAMVG